MPTQATYNKRLLKLADFLEALPRKRFVYNYWVGPDWRGDKEFSCGTTACALGWATTMPAFRRLGLRMGMDAYPYLTTDTRLGASSVIEKVFGSGAEPLFYPGMWDSVLNADSPLHTATPKQVAKFIRKHVAATEKAAA